MEIFAYGYKGNKEFAMIDDEFDYLEIEVISGNEHVYAYKNGGTGKHPICVGSVCGGYDAYAEYEGEYFVNRDNVVEWLGRSDSLYWLYEKPHQKLETSE